MRRIIVAAALLAGLAGPALAQSRTLPAGSELAAQPPIDWSAGAQRRAFEPRTYEGGPSSQEQVPALQDDQD